MQNKPFFHSIDQKDFSLFFCQFFSRIDLELRTYSKQLITTIEPTKRRLNGSGNLFYMVKNTFLNKFPCREHSPKINSEEFALEHRHIRLTIGLIIESNSFTTFTFNQIELKKAKFVKRKENQQTSVSVHLYTLMFSGQNVLLKYSSISI